MKDTIYDKLIPADSSSEQFFMIYSTYGFTTDIEISKQAFIEFVNEVGKMYDVKGYASIGRKTYCYCPESGGAIPFAYRTLRD